MGLRRDALAGRRRVRLAVASVGAQRARARRHGGAHRGEPGAINVIRRGCYADVRAPADSLRESALAQMLSRFESICAPRRVAVSVEVLQDHGVSVCAERLMAQMDRAVAAEGLRSRRLPSGAGHDGMAMHALTDIAMLFVRCKGGISHNPAESITGKTLPPERGCSRASLQISSRKNREQDPDRLPRSGAPPHREEPREPGAIPRRAGEDALGQPPGRLAGGRGARSAPLKRLGFRSSDIQCRRTRARGRMKSATNLVVRERFGRSKVPVVALNAHGDVVPPGLGWSRDPYGAKIRRGVMAAAASPCRNRISRPTPSHYSP